MWCAIGDVNFLRFDCAILLSVFLHFPIDHRETTVIERDPSIHNNLQFEQQGNS